MNIAVPLGFRLAGVHSGLKRNPRNEDVVLIVSDDDSVAAGVYTKNLICAAPVLLDRQRTPSGAIRVVVANSGCANACTGEQGERNAAQMASWAAEACGAQPHQALVLSTGIIGEQLPMEKIKQGIDAARGRLAHDDDALLAAARGILTTDTQHKIASRELSVAGRSMCITGIAKGSGMIGPNMATMLAVILTDATLTPPIAQRLLSEIGDRTFNCVSVEGHTSTNDTALLLASGAAGGAVLAGASLAEFQEQLYAVCEELARAIAQDGEGATHLITIDVLGCADREAARRIAKVVAESALVKTAIAGADPNWGRIVSAAGYAGVPFDVGGVSLKLNGTLLYDRGQPVPFDAPAVSQSIGDNRDTSVVLSFEEGPESARFWTCDLTTQYIHINADYHT